jgi:hypothetical protein
MQTSFVEEAHRAGRALRGVLGFRVEGSGGVFEMNGSGTQWLQTQAATLWSQPTINALVNRDASRPVSSVRGTPILVKSVKAYPPGFQTIRLVW